MTKNEKAKKCFVIAPIGDAESEIRRRSNQILKHIIKPIADELGYDAVRADDISEPGIITSQVIEHLLDDDLVIADLTTKNPNVFYELAVRHCAKKPIVQIIQHDETIPFDVTTTRTIHVDHRDLDSVANCKEELKKQILSVESDPSKTDSPITAAINIQTLRQSGNPLEISNAEIISMLQNIRSMIGELSGPSRSEKNISILPNMIEALIDSFQVVIDGLELPESGNPTINQWYYLRDKLAFSITILEGMLDTVPMSPASRKELWHHLNMLRHSFEKRGPVKSTKK